MVNFDRHFSAFSSRIKAAVGRTTPRLRTGTAKVREAVNPTVKSVSAAVSLKTKSVGAVVSPRLKSVGSAMTPKIKVVGAAVSLRLKSVGPALSPKVKVVSDAVSPKFKIVGDAVSPKLRVVSDAVSPKLKIVSDAVSPKVKVVSDAVSPKVKVVTDVVGPKLKIVADAVSPRVRSLRTASPKVKAICAGGALAVVAGIVAPIAITQSGHDAAYAADTAAATAVTVAPDGSTTSLPPAAKQAAEKAVEKAAAQAPTVKQLHPTGIQGYQSDFAISTDQMRNAQKIIQTGQAMGLPPRAWVIAVATSMQETKLINYGDLGSANDHDSLGLFQQRPSSGWGSPAQLQNPTYASKAFYQALTQVPGWDRMNLTDAAQAVQVSAFGDRYAQWEAHAGDVVDAFYGEGPLAQVANQVM